ncbi:hypothetical protein ABIA33_002337 [Streptacidiphilus sp. MAP12-16]|uniref:pyridoxamine 5'-phosphate oxidase family protein n=1 Tax=Streptacidiphilus sp. MAP12-16 TaxID=3156300 RepID=UPI00351792FF
MTADREHLDPQQSLRLLADMPVGRVVYTLGAMPAVLPVRFRLDGDGSLLLDATAGSELVRAVDGTVIAFETGEVDGTDGSGWSVTVLGRAHVEPGPTESPRPQAPPQAGVAAVPFDGSGHVQIRMCPELVNGRRLGTLPTAAPE